jgi:hypothetical protein
LGAGGLEFKSPRPDQNISRIFFELLKTRFTQNSPVEFGLNSEAVQFQRVRRMTNIQKQAEAGVPFRKH